LDRRRRNLLVVITVACVVAGAAYVIAAGPNDLTTDARPQGDAGSLGDARLMVRGVEGSDPRLNGSVFLVKDGRPEHPPGSKLTCERVYYAGGRGLCMAIGASGVDYQATVFDSSFRPVHEFALTGLPSRARVSSDGRYGAMTVFVAGHAYLGSSGGFSTTTTIVDMHSGEQLGQLEQFHVTRGGKPFDAVDFNFWGVTFARDSDRFYATLATGPHHYLVEGSVRDRSMRVLRDGVECPSLSPDGKRIAFKSRIGSKTRWRLKVLDLATLSDHPVAEHRSIDDQVEWLDDDTLVYSDGVNVYTVPADGGGVPRRILRNATSPVRL
jgi:WD40-like Beta Propeller Repeat